MKPKIILLHIFLFFSLLLSNILCSQEKTTYYYNGEKFEIEIDYGTISVTSDSKDIPGIINNQQVKFKQKIETPDNARSTVIPIDNLAKERQIKQTTTLELEMEKEMPHSEYLNMIHKLKKDENIIMASPSYKVNGKKMGVSNNFYVKLFTPQDINILYNLAEQYSMEVLGYDEFMPLWVTLSCTRNTGYNAVEAANIFYETNLFEYAEPEFLYHDLLATNDTYYGSQWGLKNTGQHCNRANIDIKAEKAWEITKGSPNIKVAIYDHGFEMNHPDLRNNVYGTGYDAKTGSTPSIVRGNHGTACAGIVGAVQNNSLGISGVAPSSKLMSISINLTSTDTPQELARGFNWAWQNGADVISNSWGGYAASNYITDGINNALNSGRGGKGCFIVFASGNYRPGQSQSISYPANSYLQSRFMVVGAMTPNGSRKYPGSCDGENWGGCYGGELDISAPGVLIPTTDRQGSAGYASGDYTLNFNGTSSACPHVAGVGALILSINPRLTAKNVNDIIEKTGQKVGGYAYATHSVRLNGTWHQEVGHGMVDAFEAVKLAQKYGCAENLQLNVPITSSGNYNVSNTITASASISNNLNVNFNGNTITLKPGFSVKGGNFKASIAPCNATRESIDENIPNYENYYAGVIDQDILEGNRETTSKENINISAIQVYPNPAYDHLYIDNAANSSIFIYDLTGRCILTDNINDSYSYKVDISHLQPGSYTLSINTKEGATETFKFIVQ